MMNLLLIYLLSQLLKVFYNELRKVEKLFYEGFRICLRIQICFLFFAFFQIVNLGIILIGFIVFILVNRKNRGLIFFGIRKC